MAEVYKYKCKHCGRSFKREENCILHERDHGVRENPRPLYSVEFEVTVMSDSEPYVEVRLNRLKTYLEDGVQRMLDTGLECRSTPGIWRDCETLSEIQGSLHDHILSSLKGAPCRWGGIRFYKVVEDPHRTKTIQSVMEEVRMALPTKAELEEYHEYARKFLHENMEIFSENARDVVKEIRGLGTSWLRKSNGLYGETLLFKREMPSGRYGFGSTGSGSVEMKEYKICCK